MTAELIQQLEARFYEVERAGDRYFSFFDAQRQHLDPEDAARRIAVGTPVIILEVEYRGADDAPVIVGPPTTVRNESELRLFIDRALAGRR